MEFRDEDEMEVGVAQDEFANKLCDAQLNVACEKCEIAEEEQQKRGFFMNI